MMKTSTKTYESTTTECDVCHAQDISSTACRFCKCDMCLTCRVRIFPTKSSDVVSFMSCICPCCHARHAEALERIQSILDGANRQLLELVDLIRTAEKKP